jgi:D-3-phosphoglycerate dehydrogenase / 2-oxoglutarate reductase
MTKMKVIVPEHIDESGIQVLEASNLVETVYYDDKPVSPDVYANALKETYAVLVRIKDFNHEMIQSAPNLKIIAKHGVGVDNIDVAAATERKIPVTITSTANSDAVADHAMGFMLSLSRNLPKADADLKSGQFTRREHYTGFELGGKTVGIIGLGRIGTRVAKRCALGFGMNVIAYDPFIHSGYAEKHHAELLGDLESLLKASDYVTIHTPLTELTQNMVGEKELHSMKPNAFILNTARGGIINESALYKALKNGWIKGAGLDAYVKEPPLPDENPLLELDNIMVTPHIAGGTREAAAKMAAGAAEEILRVLKGQRPAHPINPEIYE